MFPSQTPSIRAIGRDPTFAKFRTIYRERKLYNLRPLAHAIQKEILPRPGQVRLPAGELTLTHVHQKRCAVIAGGVYIVWRC